MSFCNLRYHATDVFVEFFALFIHSFTQIYILGNLLENQQSPLLTNWKTYNHLMNHFHSYTSFLHLYRRCNEKRDTHEKYSAPFFVRSPSLINKCISKVHLQKYYVMNNNSCLSVLGNNISFFMICPSTPLFSTKRVYMQTTTVSPTESNDQSIQSVLTHSRIQ